MAKSKKSGISTKKIEAFLEEVCGAVNAPGDDKKPAFTLIIGSGFSNGLIPTAYDMAMTHIPWWLYDKRDRTNPFGNPIEDAGYVAFRRELWAKIKKQTGLNFDTDETTGLPQNNADNIAMAYKAIMSNDASCGLHFPALRCQFLRDVTKRNEGEINYAHLFLGGILQAQHLKSWETELHHARPFCQTVLTTNFDTLLQRSLQLNNQLFFVSDRPEQQMDTPEDGIEAVHIIQAHGNVFHPFVANNDKEISRLIHKNAPELKNYLETHGVIVIGYGGWADTLMKALGSCASFPHNLYWCDTHSEGEWGNLRKNVQKFLKGHSDNAFYVPLPKGGADYAMRDLHAALGLKKYPKVLIDPLPNLIESIKGLRLPDSLSDAETCEESEDKRCPVVNFGDIENAKAVKKVVIETLVEFQREFTKPNNPATKLRLAYAASTSSKHGEAAELWKEVSKQRNATQEQKIVALINLGCNELRKEAFGEAIKQFAKVIKNIHAKSEQIAIARLNRGFARDKIGRHRAAIVDYSHVAESMPEISIELRAEAYFNRGYSRWDINELETAAQDFIKVAFKTNGVSEDIKTRAIVCVRGLLSSTGHRLDVHQYLTPPAQP